MLTPAFYADYAVLPSRWCTQLARGVLTANTTLARTRFNVVGLENLPAGPVLFATNSTHKNDFIALRWILLKAGLPCVTVSKAKNYHDPVMRFLLRRLGVVPLVSKGYLLLLDFTQTLGRRPDDGEYRALREHLDRDVPLPPDEPFVTLCARTRTLLEHVFEPGRESYRAFLQRLYARSLAETLRLTREAVAAGHHVQMYPEGTVAPRLGKVRPGAVQLAWALGLPIVPAGMSGCPDAFAGDSPLLRLRGGDVTIRFGAPITLPPGFLPPDFIAFDPAHEARHRETLNAFSATQLTPALNALLDPPFRRVENDAFVGKGTRAFL